jgi:hypothetical protein
MYQRCTDIMPCTNTMNSGTDLFSKHHCIHFQHTQYPFQQSKVTKKYPQKKKTSDWNLRLAGEVPWKSILFGPCQEKLSESGHQNS